MREEREPDGYQEYAESGGTVTNSWFIAYRVDLAVAAEVDGGGNG
ncbi:hypothetical protein ACIQ9P_26675 [Kitasatospora sp. NPDC094019]